MDPRGASEALGNTWDPKALILGFTVSRMDPREGLRDPWEPFGTQNLDFRVYRFLNRP